MEKILPVKLASPALRALVNAKITTLKQLAAHKEKTLLRCMALVTMRLKN